MSSRPDLHELLIEQLDWLRASCHRYDTGVHSEAKRLASTVRTLLRQTGSSHALLEQLGWLKDMRFLSQAAPLDPDVEVYGLASLVTMAIGPNGLQYEPILSEPQIPMPFELWWTMPILANGSMSFSRCDVVLALANKDGGSHVQPTLPGDYRSLTRENGLGWTMSNPDAPEPGNPVPAVMRTIAHEILSSLR
jgi:hypothetical protein